ncbi:MAG: hypothetical protein ABG776_00045 [Cyanobacteria bacterium J06555_13]
MAFQGSQPFRSQLRVNGSIDNSTTNPRNLDSIELPSGLLIDADLMQFDQASADARIDQLIAFREQCVQGKRVGDETVKTLKAYENLMKTIKQLATQCYNTEKAAAEAEVEIRTLSHQLVVIKKQLASQHAADVEKANVGFGSFEHELALELRDRTNTATPKGTIYGSTLGPTPHFAYNN